MTNLKIETANHITVMTIDRPPHNYFDADLITAIADALEALDEDASCRATVLRSNGRSFCAGGDFGAEGEKADIDMVKRLYQNGARLFRRNKPLIAAIQGAAIGGGLGLALAADIRVIGERGYFCANFTQLGIHPGFGSSYTLPRLIGPSRAALMFYTGRRIGGQQAVDWGLADELATKEDPLENAVHIAHEISNAAPLAINDTHRTLTEGLAGRVEETISRELQIQTENFKTGDFKEGVQTFKSRTKPQFKGR